MDVVYSKIRFWCILGLILSIYATYVKYKADADDNYRAMCDVGPKVSCTNVFRSEYGRSFGLMKFLSRLSTNWNPSNGIIGIIFYSLLFLSTYHRAHWLSILQVFVSLCTNILTLYLAYLLYFVLKELCLVCFFLYVVNQYLLIETWNVHKLLYRNVKTNDTKDTEDK